MRLAALALITMVSTLFALALLPLLFGWKPLVITSGSMAPLLNRGDIVLVQSTPPSMSHPIGSVLTYKERGSDVLITHRMKSRALDGTYEMKGDANPQADALDVAPSEVRGRVRLVVPLLGRVALLREVFEHSGAIFTGATTNGGNSLSTGSFYKSTVLAANPVSYWRFGESSGATAVDETGVASASYVASPTLGAAGALNFDTNTSFTATATQYAKTAPNVSALSLTTAITVETWIKPTTATQTANARIVSKYDGSLCNYFMAYDTAQHMRFFIDTTTNRFTALSASTLSDTTKWYHIVGTWNGSQVKLFINGVVDGSYPTTGTVKTNTNGVGLGATDTGNIPVKAYMDETAIYNYVLSDAVIASHYALATAA